MSEAYSAFRFLSSQWIKSSKGAIDLIDQSLKTYFPTGVSGRARLIEARAEAYLGLETLDACVQSAKEALILAQSVGSGKTIARIEKLHANLKQSPWKDEPEIAQLGTMLYSAKGEKD